MQSSMISKIQKAHQYAEEPDRVTFIELRSTFRGEHSDYEVNYTGEHWRCSCNFFPSHGVCSHIMAIQKILHNMLPREAHYMEPVEVTA
jgi:hypothetical protein